MGKKYSDSSAQFPPSAQIKEPNATLKGVMVSNRTIKTKFGPKVVYVLKVLDASCRFITDGTEVFPSEGQEVEILPPTRLAVQLSKVPVNETITIRYLGLGEKRGGQNAPHLFSVEGE